MTVNRQEALGAAVAEAQREYDVTRDPRYTAGTCSKPLGIAENGSPMWCGLKAVRPGILFGGRCEMHPLWQPK